jgi:tripartite-type tricarboxylate transporter receptor subunit TctC
VVARLNEIANTALRDKAIVDKLQVQGIVPRPMGPAEFRAFVAAEAAKFGKVIAQANIRAEN